MTNPDETRDREMAESPVGEVRTGAVSKIGRRAYLLAGLALTAAAAAITDPTLSGVSHSSGLGGG